MSGRLIAVVGPSGVGKDTVLAALAVRAGCGLVRRVITRPSDAGGEDFEGVSEARFDEMVATGAFALWWRAHGLAYGIPVSVTADLAAGRDMLVNLSRGVLNEAQARFALTVISLVARPEVLAARLAGRGRESAAEIEARLERADMGLPAGTNAIEIDNSGRLDDTLAAAMAALYPDRVTRCS